MKLNIGTIDPNVALKNTKTQETKSSESSSAEGLGATFESMLRSVNQDQVAAKDKQVEFVTSDKKDIHGTMIAMEKADVSLRLLLQVKSKLTAAYEEVMRMQI